MAYAKFKLPYTKSSFQCFIYNEVTDKMISFQLLPDDLSENYSSSYDDSIIRGRSSPIRGYDSSGPHTFSASFQLYDEYCLDGILVTVNNLKALTFPGYSGESLQPPSCKVCFGKMLYARCTVNSCSVTWKKPYIEEIYVNAIVNMDFTEINNQPYSASDIESNRQSGYNNPYYLGGY